MTQTSGVNEEKVVIPSKNDQQESFPSTLNASNSNYQTLLRQRDNVPDGLEKESLYVYKGPLPSPSELEKYEQIQPGSAKQILEMVMNEGKSRQTMQLKILADGVQLSTRGQTGSICLVALAMMISIVGVFMKNDVALVIGAVLAIILVVLFEAPRVIAEKKQKDSKTQSSSSSESRRPK